MKSPSHKRKSSVRFRLHEVPREVKVTETGSRMVIARLKEGEWGSYGLMSTESALGEDEKVLEKAGVDGCIAVWMFLIIIKKRMDDQREARGQSELLTFSVHSPSDLLPFYVPFWLWKRINYELEQHFLPSYILCVIWLRLHPVIIKISPNSGVGSPCDMSWWLYSILYVRCHCFLVNSYG